ncbi:MAG: sigma-54-dependent Fis family transcriptional regulator [Lentisphaeria bacterium]|nr:sigma-54-dependent Fis family transcriptional regulator [Lentisphaeria bacterium]
MGSRSHSNGEIRFEAVRSPLMHEVLRRARLVAQTRTTVLLSGETGTGKGVLARTIHGLSNRSRRQFVSVHCGAIPDPLIESELFGHEKGAFTGAYQRRSGRFEAAHGGTIFLDEVGTLSKAAQIRLLQVLQERQFQRVGGNESLAVDVRVIAASNTDLRRLCEQGAFRQDLYFRLNVFPIEIPPLRQRREDIPGLLRGFLKVLNGENRKHIRAVRREVMDALCRYDWPGNVRELENVVERAFILEAGTTLTLEGLPAEVAAPQLAEAIHGPGAAEQTLAQGRRAAIEAFERAYLTSRLRQCRGRIDRTAEACGITPRQLHNILRKHNIQKQLFREPGGDYGT